jgi:hypothetical protein
MDHHRPRTHRHRPAPPDRLDPDGRHRRQPVLQGRGTPQLGEPVARSDEDVPGRLAATEYMLQQIAKKLEGIDVLAERVHSPAWLER